MKCRLYFLLIISSYFYSVNCAKQLFSLLEKTTTPAHKHKKGSIFGSYLEKVEKKINKTHEFSSAYPRFKSSKKHLRQNRKNKKLSVKAQKKKRIISSKKHRTSHNIIAKNTKSHTVFNTIKKSKSKHLKNNLRNRNRHRNNYRYLKKRITFLEKKMDKYINLNNELIKELRKHNKNSGNHNKLSNKHSEETNDDD